MLHVFATSEGFVAGGSVAALLQASNGVFYGTTYFGGTKEGGTVFAITLSGEFTTLYNFDPLNGPGGVNPGGLIQGSDGNLYGTTFSNWQLGCGEGIGCETIFKITPAGEITTIYYSSPYFGAYPFGLVEATNVGLVEATNGVLFGTAGGDPNQPYGSLFSLPAGLSPFVEAIPAAAESGSRIRILGTNLSATSAVTFNGLPAAFTVVSSSEITTSVPAKATTGRPQVVTPAGTISSNGPFRVISK